ncbi:hypothetical protein D1007_18005 [Hordeum vulgare]|uniref:DUF7595 domain-containing protein n=1 Tax=Hordeum vulgare subsp. vulgare TaxID=112509 RepID=A0A8I6YVL1_HORVV|nr:uncharacterized protein LOC123452475 [Hordeum vulgare subsp. vulgare]KAE8805856.1 hypothetical protein D1007_18005 [Hordeum vulgare]
MDPGAAPAPPIPPGSAAPDAADSDVDATLPVDLLLEIAARSDAASVVRCAAAAKPLRRAILDRGFRRLLAQRATATSGYDPSLLRGVSYKVEDSDADHPVRVVQAVPADEPSVLRGFNVSLDFEPVASRDGLVVLRRLRPRPVFGQSIEEAPPGSVLRVCHSFTGAVSVLPSVSIRDYRKHALLSVEDNGRAFELLVADERLRIQIYSSREGRWGPVRAALPRRQSRPFHDSYPLVIGRIVHWLCNPEQLPPLGHLFGPEPYIVAVDADTMEATVIDLPRGCTSRMTASMSHRGLLLASSVDGRLKVVVSETQVISMWTMSPPVEGEPTLPPRWVRQVLIDKQDWGVHSSVQFEGFGLRSGTVILYVGRVGLIRLNLATKEAVIVYHLSDIAYISQVCLHEIDLSSLLQTMKPLS